MSSFNSILDIHYDNIEAMFYKANTLVELDRADEAIGIYNKLISKTREHSHFGWEWMIKDRSDVKSAIYAEFNDF